MNALRSPLKTRLALIALLAWSAPALAGSGVTEQTVTIDKLTHVENGAVISTRGCPTNSVSNAANFFGLTQGSQITLQLGLVEGEGFGATFNVPASQYPIQINTVEFFIGSVAAVQTTTGYSVLIYDGLPTGSPVYVESSEPGGSQFGGLDDVVLVPANATCNSSTTNASAARVTAGIDPSEPPESQWFLNNTNGHNCFTVIIRIDRHNNNAAPTCGPFNQCQNAFLATEATNSGALNFPTLDWLLAIDCGASFCPAGATRFSDLNIFCKPTRDPLIGATWTSQSCAATVAACCASSGTCTLTTQASCVGTWNEGVLSCDAFTCPQPTGACCFGTSCSPVDEANCIVLGGSWLGAGVPCSAGNACPTGACCMPNGTCVPAVTSLACTQAGGSFRGIGTNCSSPCPQPTGACCTAAGGCAVVSQSTCNFAGGTWQGPGTTCSPSPCTLGACCTGSTCSITTVASCAGTHQGVGTTCSGWPSNPLTCCPANYNQMNGVDVADLFMFLDAWFLEFGLTGPGLQSDFIPNDAVDVADLFGFLDAWFAGCH
ncbi:MAG TPA: hypothetical protein PL072_09295 [Phycisphaerales bacterium]|nr:hypothetical protein [Phycisphaerales bacterium]